MKQVHRVSWNWLLRHLRRQLLAGILLVIPLGITILILIWIFTSIDNILQPVIEIIWGRSVPGVGVGVTVVLIYIVGLIANNVFGKRIVRYGESLLAKVPVIRPLYAGIKQFLESFTNLGKTGLTQAVLIEFPRKGIWTMGFITNELPTQSGKAQLNIFIPTSPNPTSGFLQIVREDDVVRTNIPVDEALKMIISAGRMSPQEISDRLSGRDE